ncbi:ADP-heptose--LPS heptosyltransferase [Caballeronia sp. LZ034LL]|uniref:glycosyltransferase family 9 protein n=1 Tax=Caballeronia sp. LZ034LL TaxID=3038567 RepID=UPI00285FEC37|nr:ADP-heptose--LPS heptosyltransferase [Caballeronia sp. LZ034LL]MDR5834668.1 ADP-heptose--LPS heptosyltransferase [Caballeronia sp. LZ034LL]
MKATLDDVQALTHAGSLLSGEGMIVAPYDLEIAGGDASGHRPLGGCAGILHAGQAPFQADYANAQRVHLINAFGVTLGDSIIGLTALFALKRRHPHLSFTIYRPSRAPRYVQRLYELAAPQFGELAALPVPFATLPATDLKIDLGNQLFWPQFATLPMIDFFLWALGLEPASVAAHDKCNRWLADLPLAPFEHPPYALFCPGASTPVRSISASAHVSIVERLADATGLYVLGFGPVDHPRYRDIAPLSVDTVAFLAWVGHARCLVTADSAALHVAAGFNVPTTAFFTTIPAHLRARDYANCVAVEMDVPGLRGMHASARATDLLQLERAFRDYDWRTMPLVQLPAANAA